MIVLLSPSKTQDFEGPAPAAVHTQPRLLRESETLIAELRRFSVREISALMGVSENIAALNRARFEDFRTPFTPRNARQAVFAFQGDVYDGFNVQSLDETALDFAQAHVRILSGLYGLLRPLDLIQPYRLEMKTALANPRGKDVYAFWGSRITDALREELAHMPSPLVVNLASQEYAAAVDFKALGCRVVAPQFKEKQASAYKTIGLFAKKARGRMAHYICAQHIENAEALHFFSEDDYRLNVALSGPQAPVYTREKKKPAAAAKGDKVIR